MQSAEDIKAHRDMVDNARFTRAADAALLQLIMEANLSGDQDVASAGYWRIQGAKDFLRIFCSLADEPTPRKSLPNINLQHHP